MKSGLVTDGSEDKKGVMDADMVMGHWKNVGTRLLAVGWIAMWMLRRLRMMVGQVRPWSRGQRHQWLREHDSEGQRAKTCFQEAGVFEGWKRNSLEWARGNEKNQLPPQQLKGRHLQRIAQVLVKTKRQRDIQKKRRDWKCQGVYELHTGVSRDQRRRVWVAWRWGITAMMANTSKSTVPIALHVLT